MKRILMFVFFVTSGFSGVVGASHFELVKTLGACRAFTVDKVEPSQDVEFLTLDVASPYRPLINSGFVVVGRDNTVMQLDLIADAGQTISSTLARLILESEAQGWEQTSITPEGVRLYKSGDGTRFASYSPTILKIWTAARQAQHLAQKKTGP